MSAFIAVVGYCRCFCCSSLLSVLSVMWMRLYYRAMLLSELDTAGHTDALETPLLLSSDSIVADVELDQGPIILDADSEFMGKPWSIPAVGVMRVVIGGDVKLGEDQIPL
jgi:hypothetical protein